MLRTLSRPLPKWEETSPNTYVDGGGDVVGCDASGFARFGARSTWLAAVHSASRPGLFAYLLRTIASALRTASFPRLKASSSAALAATWLPTPLD